MKTGFEQVCKMIFYNVLIYLILSYMSFYLLHTYLITHIYIHMSLRVRCSSQLFIHHFLPR